MKRYYYICIIVLLFTSSLIYSQSIYQSQYYKNPPGSGIINIKNIEVPKDTSKKRINKLNDDENLIFLKNLGMAKEYLYKNDILKIYEELDKVDSVLRDLPESFYIRALAHWKINDISFARYYFIKALSVGTDDYKIYEDAAKFFIEIGLYEEALRVYLHAYKRSDDHSWLFEGASSILNFDEQSANYYFALLTKSSYDAFGIEGISDIASKNSNYTLALNGYNVALSEYQRSKYKRTKLYKSNIGRIKQKINRTRLDIRIDGWQQKFRNGEFQSALSILNDISRTTKVKKDIYLLNAKTYFEMGEYERAETLIEYSIANHSSLEEAFVLKAQIEINKGKMNRAVKSLEDGLIYNYDKIILYDAFLNTLKVSGSKYYYESVLLDISKVSEPDYQQSILLSQYYLEKNDYRKAKEILSKIAIKTKESNLLWEKIDNVILLEKSEENRRKGNYKAIIKSLYNETFDKDEEDLRARLLANALYQLGDLPQAIEILSLKLDNKTLSLNNTYFLQHLINSNKQNALIEIDETFIIKVNNWQQNLLSNPKFLKDKINEFLTFDQYNEAISYLEDTKKSSQYSSIVIDNLQSKVYAQLAGKLYDENRIEEAQNAVSVSLSKNRYDVDAIYVEKLLKIYYKWGNIENYLLEDNYRMTIAMATDFLNQLPASLNIRMILIRALALERNIESIDIMKRINNMDIYNHLRLSLLSDIYYGFGMYDYCAELYEKSLYENFNLQTAVMYAHTLDKLERVDEALKLALDITIKYPENSYGYYLSSQFYLKKNNVNVAFNLINTAISMQNNIKYQFQLGLCYEQINDWGKAFQIYTNILNKNKYYSDVYVHIIEILLEEKKDLYRAKSLAEMLVDIDPQNPYYYYLLANTCHQLGTEDSVLKSDKIDFLNLGLMFYQNAIYRTIYGKDAELRVIIKDNMKLINKDILYEERP